MNLLVKKAWCSLLTRSCSHFRSPPASDLDGDVRSSVGSSLMGPFEMLPTDVFILILHLLGPRDAARAAAVCRTWRVIVSDNRLWILFLQSGIVPLDSIVFAETQLRSGLPHPMYFDHSPQLSFMHIYAQREKVPSSVIIDGGSGYCKYGWSKYSSPSGCCATFQEFGNIEFSRYSGLRHFFSVIYSRMQVMPFSQPVIVSLPICHYDDTESARASREQLKETICSVLFDMNAPVVCAVDQAVLALYAAKCTSGIVVNIGFRTTSIVPILHGKVMREVGVEIVSHGAFKLTAFLKELLQRRNINLESLSTVHTIKEKLCYVAADYDAELSKDSQASCEVAGHGLFTLSKERFQAAEIFFQPHIAGLSSMGLHQAVALCMNHCLAADELSSDGWYKTVVLAGGTSCLPGLSARLEKELHKLLPSSISEGIKVIPPPYGANSAWFGAKIVSTVSTFSDAWCVTKKQFQSQSSYINPW